MKITKVDLNEILGLRNLFLQENNFQIRFNACHERGWTDSYALKINDLTVGYAAIKGKEEISHRNSIFEFYLLPPYRKLAIAFFRQLITEIKVQFIECQSNDFGLTAMLYQFAQNIQAEAILFLDSQTTDYQLIDNIFRAKKSNDAIFQHQVEPEGDYVLEKNGEIVATGGFFTHYNFPFADLYMEVKPEVRRQGLGALLIQELKKQCYQAGRVPAARCNVQNQASQATLLKAGMHIAGFVLNGKISV
jgi:GNAT superfamily N-acetyltransferase